MNCNTTHYRANSSSVPGDPTLLYTTHYMEEAERLADRIVVIDHGKVIADDTLQGLTRGDGTLESAFLALTGRSLRD